MNPLTFVLVAAAALAAAPTPRLASREPVILFWWHTRPALVKPDGTGLEKLQPFSDHNDPGIGYARFSPDGRRILATTDVEDGPEKTRYDLFVREPRAEGKGDRIGTNSHGWYSLFWAPDGPAIIGTERDPSSTNKEVNWLTVQTDPRSQRRTPLSIPKNVLITDVSADGKTYLATRWGDKECEVGLIPADKPTQFAVLTEGREYARAMQLSPDGRKALAWKVSGAGANARRCDLLVIDVAQKKLASVVYLGNTGIFPSPPATWSPDGRGIAYVQIESVRVGPDDKWDYQLTVCNADGSHPKMILRTKDQITSID